MCHRKTSASSAVTHPPLKSSMYKNKKELLQLLQQEGLAAKKDFGQNFLLNHGVLRKIIQAAELKPGDQVIEVGPGMGILTQQLLKHAGHVRSIELDPTLHEYLERNFPTLELEKGNALKADLPQTPYKLVANIPYHITSPLLRHFLSTNHRPQLVVLLVQKEVAQKICAKDGDHSVLSLQVQVFGKPSIVAHVPSTDFYPAPKVDSAILKIEVHDKPLIQNAKLFSTITRIAFAGRRKTLLNTLKNYTRTSREETEAILNQAGIDPIRRPQTLSLEEWRKLIEALQ